MAENDRGTIDMGLLDAIGEAIQDKLNTQTAMTPAAMPEAIRSIPTSSAAVIQSLTVTQNGSFYPPIGVDGFGPVTVNVDGGDSVKGFEVYAADGSGNSRRNAGMFDNQYFVCYFDDNMSTNYTLNGQTYTYSTIAAGKQQTLATTKAVTDNADNSMNSVMHSGSIFTASHYDTGSYISVVGGWIGYPEGGTIFENAAYGTNNSITLDAAYNKLLVFIGACFNSDGITSVDINGTTYNITNIGNHYGAYGAYGAIEIDNNSDTVLTATFPISGWSYMSIIGIAE